MLRSRATLRTRSNDAGILATPKQDGALAEYEEVAEHHPEVGDRAIPEGNMGDLGSTPLALEGRDVSAALSALIRRDEQAGGSALAVLPVEIDVIRSGDAVPDLAKVLLVDACRVYGHGSLRLRTR
ncbi:hypothetical protein [Methylobacterium sp. D48H]